MQSDCLAEGSIMFDKALNKMYSAMENCMNRDLLKKSKVHSMEEEKSGWSFVISTDARNIEMLRKLIESIKTEMNGNSEYEIILIGNITEKEIISDDSLTVLQYKDVRMPAVRGWITRKKNIAVKYAKFDKIVILHDYIKLDKGWYEGYNKFGNDFDVVCNRVKLIDGRRANDWVCWTSEVHGLTQCCLPYDASIYGAQYVSGNYIVCKRNFFLQHPFDERLKWGEGEDIAWSYEIQKYTKVLMNKMSSVSFMKEKQANWPPYCKSWVEASIKASEIFNSKEGLEDIFDAYNNNNYGEG